MSDPAKEKIVRHLQDAVKQLHDDIARVELWAGALGCFAQPVPEYDAANSNLNKYILPSAGDRKRASSRDAVQRR